MKPTVGWFFFVLRGKQKEGAAMRNPLMRKWPNILLVLALVVLMLPPVPAAAVNRYEQDHPSISYTGFWVDYGYMKASDSVGATATFTFVGTRVSWIASKTPNRGIAYVFLDGVSQGSVDLYSSTYVVPFTAFSKTGLTSSNHTLKIEVTANKNAGSSGNVVEVDAFETDGSATRTSPPSNVSVSAPTSGGSLVISWTNPSDPGFSHVEIERNDKRYGDTRILPDKFTSSPAEDKTLAGGVAYSYRLRAVTSAGVTSDWTEPVSATPFSPAPTEVKVENEGSGGGLVISWTNPPTGTYDFIRIYRSSVAGSLGIPVTLGRIDETSYTDTGLTNGATYYYIVRSVDFAVKESLNTDQYSGVPSVAAAPIVPSRTLFEEASLEITYGGTWKDQFDSSYSGGSARTSNSKGATATFSFTGTSVSWISALANDRGIARVYIDDAQDASVDLFSASKIFKRKVYAKTGLADAAHTLKIEVTEGKNSASSGTQVDIDAFSLDPAAWPGVSPPSTTVAGVTTSPGSGEIVGRVVNRAGQTIPGTAVRVNSTVVPTNPGGEFRFTLVSQGVYTIYYDAPGYRGQTQVIEVKSGQSTRCPTVIMDPGITSSTQGEIFGRIVNPAHQPLAWAAVRINNVAIPTNASGEFRFQLVNPGIYTIYYDAAGYAGQKQEGIEVKAGMVTYPPMVILSGTLGEIFGRVLDAGTRKPIPGTAVRVNGSVMPTNPGGEFRFTLVHPGIYKVFYDAPGYKGQVQENIAVFAGTTTICSTVLMSR